MKRLIDMTKQGRWLLLSVAACCLLNVNAQNPTQTVTTVSSAVTLSTDVDYVVTSTTPFTTSGSINITSDDAVVIFPNLKPSVVMNQWLGYISVNGTKANRSSVWVGIWDNGAIVYPHPKENYTPLTVFTKENYGGEQRSDFLPFDYYNNVSALGAFDNNIRSFRLKRGYMATLATNYDGTGYSRVFIAQDGDVEVPELQRELKGRTSFIRVFPWNRVTKKGCGAFDWNPGNVLNVSWGYDWGAGASPFPDDVDYVAMHHHEDWPNFTEIANGRAFNTVLGNNEPDNLNDPSQNPIPAGQMEAVLFGENGLTGNWKNIYKSGCRVGSPAMAGDYEFLRQFMDLCRKYNCRIDFIATHRYLMGTGWDYDWFINWVWDQYHLPIWITEWNYGAEWNGDLVQGPDFFRDQIASIIPIMEANPHLERQAFFNVLGDVNRMMTNRHDGMKLMPAGNWYRDYRSVTSYTGGEGYVMTWNYWAPKDLTVEFDDVKHTATLSWLNLNGKQTDSTLVERRLENETDWTVIDRRYLQPQALQIMRSDTLRAVTGLVTYRVRNFDSDGRVRMTNEVQLALAASNGTANIQFGNILLKETKKAVPVDFTVEMERVPSLFIGPTTLRNANTTTEPLLQRGNITTTGFTYTPLPWQKQSGGSEIFEKNEEVGFVALPQGNWHYDGDIDVEVGNLTLRDTTVVQFKEAFPAGVTPVVIATVTRATQTSMPTLHKVWDVTNEGFKCMVMYEDANNAHVGSNQQLSYLAMTPGKAVVDSEAGICMAAGLGERALYSIAREESFRIPSITVAGEWDTLYVDDPVVLAEIQTYNTPVPTTVRLLSQVNSYKINDEGESEGLFTTGVRLRRMVDKSVNTNRNVDAAVSADNVGWVIVYKEDPNGVPTAIGQHIQMGEIVRLSPLHVTVTNRIVEVEGYDDFELFTSSGTRAASNATQQPGVYIVRAGGRTQKVLVK